LEVPQGKLEAGTLIVESPYLSTVDIDYPLDYGHAYAGVTAFPLGEGKKDTVDYLIGNPGGVVPDQVAVTTIFPVPQISYLDNRVLTVAVVDGVADEVGEHLLYLRGIGGDKPQVAGGVHLYSFLLDFLGSFREYPFNDLSDIYDGSFSWLLSRFRQGKKVFDEPLCFLNVPAGGYCFTLSCISMVPGTCVALWRAFVWRVERNT